MENKKYLSLEGLREYDGLIKQRLKNHTHSYNDLTDKTHWVENGVGTKVLVDQAQYAGGEYASLYSTSDESELAPVIYVTLDGTKYECERWYYTEFFEEETYYGNGVIKGIDHYEDKPFLISCSKSGSYKISYDWNFVTDDTDTHTVTIEIPSETATTVIYHPLDERYIPDTIARKSDLSSITVEEATHATSADTATTAETAETATKATQDGNGAVITDTYETKEDAQTKYNDLNGSKANVEHTHSYNDLTDRTHWVEGGGMAEILPECQPVYDESDEMFVVTDTPTTMEPGQTITVTVNWNGTPYECQTYWTSMDSENDLVAFGNSEVLAGMLGITAETNECPFAIASMPGMSVWMFIPLDESTEITVSVYGAGEVIHHLDPKYIKDMYYVERVPVTSLSETTYENVSSPIQIQTALPITVGATYTIMWNGTPYECTALSGDSGFTFIGNGSIYGGLEDTGEPFFIITSYSNNMSIIMFNDGSSTVTLSYTGAISKVHTIDPKYIPESVLPRNTNLVNGSAKGSLRTVYSAEESEDYTIGDYAFAEGYDTKAYKRYSHAEGKGTTASSESAHAEGETTTASGICSHAEGCSSKAFGSYSHAEGYNTKASTTCSHAEGYTTTASGVYSHSEGYNTVASGDSAHAEGHYVTAKGKYSHAEGYMNGAMSDYQHVQGKYNIKDESGRYAHIVGNGAHVYYDDGTHTEVYSNAHTLDWDGNAWYSGKIKMGGTSYDDAAEVALKSDLDSHSHAWVVVSDTKPSSPCLWFNTAG